MDKKYAKRYKELGLNIAFYRRRKELTQEQLAEKLDIDQTHVSKIEVASVGISMDKLFHIAEILGVEPSKLLEYRD